MRLYYDEVREFTRILVNKFNKWRLRKQFSFKKQLNDFAKTETSNNHMNFI